MSGRERRRMLRHSRRINGGYDVSGRLLFSEHGVGVDAGVVGTIVTVVSRPDTPAAGADELKD